MKRTVGTIRAYLELSRISNLPTCWTNVLVGCAAAHSRSEEQLIGFSWVAAVIVGLAISLMYVGGMALNDACDVATDTCERPTRPIPSGRASCRGAYVYAGWCLGLGLGVLTFAGTAATVLGGALAACIMLYNVLHRRFAFSVVLMGICRGLVYLVAAAALAGPDVLGAIEVGGAMTLYIALLSIIARRETDRSRMRRVRWLALALPIVILLPALLIRVPADLEDLVQPGWAATLGVAAVGWILFCGRHLLGSQQAPGRTVLGWLAGICLVDAFFLALLAPWLGLDWPLVAWISLGCFALTIAGHRRILGT
ncbi:MAG: UbiA family prenyltransferase [Planctomycetota bacterium]|jgi:4-hydroxybenzoate polyprenyltransferase